MILTLGQMRKRLMIPTISKETVRMKDRLIIIV
jgi:hypothetical protein